MRVGPNLDPPTILKPVLVLIPIMETLEFKEEDLTGVGHEPPPRTLKHVHQHDVHEVVGEGLEEELTHFLSHSV